MFLIDLMVLMDLMESGELIFAWNCKSVCFHLGGVEMTIGSLLRGIHLMPDR